MTPRSDPPACSRTWQVEALRDGRLSDLDRRAVEEHTSVCERCAREVVLLDELEETMAEIGPRPNPFSRSHLRGELIARTASGARGRRSRSFLRAPYVRAAAAIAAIVLASVIVLRARSPRASLDPAASGVVTPPRYEVVPGLGATLTSVVAGASVAVRVVDGAASFDVAPLERSQRFVVHLPDADIEANGARFSVHVASNRTEVVRVEEGALTLRSSTSVTRLVAGGKWARLAVPTSSSDAMHPASSPVETAASVARGEPRAPAADAIPEPPSSAPALAGQEFDAALAAFRRADYDLADTMFESFARDRPSDPRAEDAAYLRAVCRWRQGDHEGAARRAREYLAAHPSGLRRVEAARMADVP